MNRHAQVQPSNVAEAFRPPCGDLEVAATWLLLLAIALLALALAGCGQEKNQGPPTFDLGREEPALTISAAQQEDGLISIAAGDVNGDGQLDIIAGAPRADGPADSRPGCGEVYVIFGPAARERALDLAQGEQDVTILGSDGDDNMGFSIATGDVNVDGIDDILLGAPGADGPANDRPQAGEAYVVFGSPSLEPTIDIALGQQDLTLFGTEEEDRLGISLAIGDASGDGNKDILVGAFLGDGPDNARYQGGEAYLVFGGPSLGGTRDMAQGEYDLAIMSADEDDQLGYDVATGDLNNDGIGDLILGAFRADGPDNARNDAGEVYVVFGSRDLGGVLDLASTPPDVTVSGADAEDDLGEAVASGDVNGDGVEDLLIGASMADGTDNARDRAGEAYVIFGSPSLQGSLDIDRGEQDVTILGADPGDRLGVALASGDVDGDGIDDVVLGAEGADGQKNDRDKAGEAYVVLGSAALEATLDIALGGQAATIVGEQAEDEFGMRVAVADWDSDDRADVLATARSAGPEGAREAGGRAYVISVGPRLRHGR
jgi:hypothetical protein